MKPSNISDEERAFDCHCSRFQRVNEMRFDYGVTDLDYLQHVLC